MCVCVCVCVFVLYSLPVPQSIAPSRQAVQTFVSVAADNLNLATNILIPTLATGQDLRCHGNRCKPVS